MLKKAAAFISIMMLICMPVIASASDTLESETVEIVSHINNGLLSGNWQIEYKVKNVSNETISDVILNGVVYDEEGDIKKALSFTTLAPVEPDQSVYITFSVPESSGVSMKITSYNYTNSNGISCAGDFSFPDSIRFNSSNEDQEDELLLETEIIEATETDASEDAEEAIEERTDANNLVEIISSEVTELTDESWTVECTIQNNTDNDINFVALSGFVYNDQKDRINASNAETEEPIKPGETGILVFSGTETNAKYLQYYNYFYTFSDGSTANGEFNAQEAEVIELVNRKMLEAPILTKEDFIVTNEDPGNNIDDLFLQYDGDTALFLDSTARNGGLYCIAIDRNVEGVEISNPGEDFYTYRGIRVNSSTKNDILNSYGIGVDYKYTAANDPMNELTGDDYVDHVIKNYATEVMFYTFKNQYQMAFYIDATEDVIAVCYTNYVCYQADKATVQYVQETLNSIDYDCGSADGIAGPNTTAAVQKYQEDHGLFVSGAIDDELLKNLY